MSLDVTLARIAELQRLLQPPTPAPVARPAATAASFSGVLGQATATASSTGVAPVAAAGGSRGAQMVALAQAELGVTEQPPGSNDAPRIAEYRAATAGSGVGPWCNYFVSWIAKQAGAPLGEQGQGFGLVSATWDWAQRTGRAIPAGSTPQPGDLIVWDGRHIGMVEAVLPDGRVQTIEGNSSNMVTRRVHGADGDGATGYVRL
jgi:CHAP domain